ncbi:Gp138 family membrane-puncturing spike protein [Yersinia sp. Marseille-Q5920]|uniref:Gp138 family membrane-puncturing spike protein n=1 Tax=Yersinia sp. Marseille-Q5920 TaxID=2972785 RepID=UPI00226516EB|nr:Gp138 family membrane-puncturing spike protein [Yersinia sp. Marseille-Q5920]
MMIESNPLYSTMMLLKRDMVRDLMIGMPGKVISYNADLQRAVVECGIQRHIGDGQFKTLPVIEHVPVQFSGSAEWTVFHELPPGTEGYIHFSQRSIDNWLSQGLPTEGIGLSNKSGGVRIHLTDSGMTLTAGSTTLALTESGMSYSGPEFTNDGQTTLNGRTKVTQGGLAIGELEVGDHDHGGVQHGNDRTDGPQ